MRNHTLVYWSWTQSFRRFTDLCIVLQSIINFSLPIRKELLGLCRTQSLPTHGSSLRASMQYLHTSILVPSAPSNRLDDTDYVSMTLLDLIFLYPDVFLDHLLAAIVAHALRIAPISDEAEYQKAYLDTVAKELNAAVNTFNHASLDFRSIFSANASHRSIPLCNRLPESEEVASDTYSHFCQLRNSLSYTTVFPRGGSKTVGKIVAEAFWKAYYQHGLCFKHEGDANEDQVTVDDCLRLYQETGGYPEGPVEVRTSWKYAQINPRVYYARGGDVQPAAQYIQAIVNIMIDEFPEVHRIDRFSPPPTPLSDDDVEIIYDYASFTSNLDAVIPFVDELSQFFHGTTILCIDPVRGIVPRDLGDMLSDYNRICNAYAKFDISRLSVTGDQDTIFEHTCGMLGVEGNIFLATLLHGIFLRFIAGLERSKCVGDDGRFHHRTQDGQFHTRDREYLFWMLSSLGSLNSEKIMAFEAQPMHDQVFRYIKRPFYRHESIMISGLLLALPSQIPLTGALDSYHTVIPSSTHPCRIVFKQIIRFLDTLAIHSVNISSTDDSYAIATHLYYLRRLLREKDPDGQYSEVGHSNRRSHYHLPPIELWGCTKYVDWFVESISLYELVKFPKLGGAEEEGSCDGRVGSMMLRSQSKARSFLVRMGYLEEELQFDEYSIDMLGTEEFTRMLQGQYTPVSLYRVVRSVPVWYTYVPRSL